HPDVSVTAAEMVRRAIPRFLPATCGIEVPMVRVLFDQRVGAGIGINRVRTNEVRAGEVVPEMAIDRVDEKEFAMLVPIVPPRIGGAGADCFHNFAPWMITPNRAAQGNALLRRR